MDYMRYLENINCPEDLKKLSLQQLNALCNEVRQFLLSTVSQTGGHLASNLGVVELSVALHYVLNSPDDKILWDVGHQCYTHKLLTGRKEQFDTLRKFGGMSGFVKSCESAHDTFDVGHSSTSLSVAAGMAVSRDLLGQGHKVCAVIGDGAMTSGLALEAMNNIGRNNSDVLVVLNDNQMSISENVGVMARRMNEMRAKPAYINVKRDVKSLLKNIPHVGENAQGFLDNFKTKLKYMMLPGVLFEELGFKYYGPVDGHNMRELTETLANLQHVKGAVILHVVTKKGKGYAPAERASQKFHGTPPFDVKTGLPMTANRERTYTDVFSDAMVELGKKNEKIVAVSAAMPSGTGLAAFKEQFGSRFFDVGIAESHAVTFAAGMAKTGLRPVVAIYSTFLQRAYDQILHDVCLQNLPVVFMLDRSGIVEGDGETHQGVFDVSFLSHMPNMTIMAPRSSAELVEMLDFAVQLGTPVAIRYPKDAVSALPILDDVPIELGKWEVLQKGSGVAILSLGSMMEVAAKAWMGMYQKGHAPTLVNVRFAKPVCPEMLKTLACYDHVFVLEENVATGGFGQMVRAGLNELGILKPVVHTHAMPDKFLPQGTRAEIFAHLGLCADSLIDKILQVCCNE